MRKIPDGYWTVVIYFSLILVAFSAFWQLPSCDYVYYDDPLYVTKNPHVLSGLSFENIIWAFTSGYASNWHPLTWLSHMLDCELFGTNLGWHHVTSLLLHIASGLLLFAVLKKMTGAIWQSAFVAALFAIHPLHVESVAWLSQRKDVLSTFFWMLTIAYYVRYVQHPSSAGYLLTLLLFVLGLMAKPMLVTLPFVFLLLDYWPLNRIESISLAQTPYRQTILRLVREKIPFFALSAASSVVTFFVQQSGTAVIQIHRLSLMTRIANTTVSCVEYIEKMFWLGKLAIFYPYLANRLEPWRVTITVLFCVFVTIQAVRLSPRCRFLAVGWFWYLGTLVPVIGLVQVGLQAMADRYTYVPLTGLFIMIAWGVPELLKNWRYKKIILALSALAVISTLSICTWFQTGYWRNNITVCEHAIKVTEENYMAYSMLAYSLRQQGKLEQALEYDTKALQIYSGYVPTHNNIAHTLFEMGRLDEALTHFKRILPDFSQAHKNIGKIYSLQGKLEEAAGHFQEALLSEPLNAELRCELGTVLGRQGKFGEAAAQFNEAIRIKPDFANAYSNLGYVFLCQDKFDEAIAPLTQAVQLDPNSDKSHYYLAIALSEQGLVAEAVTHYEDAIRLKPDWVEPMNSLAWLLATHKGNSFYNPQKALQLAKRACELTSYRNIETLDILAAAYAADGNFTEAVTAAENALKLAGSSADNKLTDEIQKRLDLYKTGRPYVDFDP